MKQPQDLRVWSERSHRLLLIAMALILLLAGTQRRAMQARKKAPAPITSQILAV